MRLKLMVMTPGAIFLLVLALIYCVGAHPTQESVPEDTLITLQRSTCFGTCPDYTLTISANGDVTFTGRYYVKVKDARGKIGTTELGELIKAFERASFFKLRNQYSSKKDGCPEVWTDNPGVITSIRMNGKSKTITHYHGCQGGMGSYIYPKELTELESQIDQIVGTEKWIR